MAYTNFALNAAVTVYVPGPFLAGAGFGNPGAQPGVSAPALPLPYAVYALPGTGATLIVTNVGQGVGFALLGSGANISVNSQTGIAIPANSSVPLAVGSNDHIAVCGLAGSTQFNLAQGT